MTSPRQLFTGIGTLKAGAAGLALAALGGCANGGFIGGASGPQVYSGTATPYVGPGSQQFQNGWEVVPGTTVNLTPVSPPRMTRANVVLTREASPQDVEMVKICSNRRNVPDAGRHAECRLPTLPSQALFELSNQLIYANIKCSAPTAVTGRNPSTNSLDTYLRAACSTTGDYSVKLQQGGPIMPVIIGNRPAY